MSQRKGGGHSRGQTMPYSVVRSWSGKAPTRTPAWNLGAAEENLLGSLRAANSRDLDLEIHIIDRATGEIVSEPLRCVVCDVKWATETGLARGADAPSVCVPCST